MSCRATMCRKVRIWIKTGFVTKAEWIKLWRRGEWGLKTNKRNSNFYFLLLSFSALPAQRHWSIVRISIAIGNCARTRVKLVNDCWYAKVRLASIESIPNWPTFCTQKSLYSTSLSCAFKFTGESPVSARSGDTQPDSDSGHYVPAAHFHLTDKIDHSSHQLYIGKETANTDTKWKKHFTYNRGHLRVIQPGLYYVYAQICYENPYDENGFVIYHENKPFLNCLNTVPTNMRKLHTCHTSGLIQLKENESIQLRPLLNHEDHKEILREDNNRSYIGIIKLHGQV